MTLEQLKTELRLAYDSRDRERHEWALRMIAGAVDAAAALKYPIVKNQSAEWPLKEREQ